jgi:hypothetical protein
MLLLMNQLFVLNLYSLLNLKQQDHKNPPVAVTLPVTLKLPVICADPVNGKVLPEGPGGPVCPTELSITCHLLPEA